MVNGNKKLKNKITIIMMMFTFMIGISVGNFYIQYTEKIITIYGDYTTPRFEKPKTNISKPKVSTGGKNTTVGGTNGNDKNIVKKQIKFIQSSKTTATDNKSENVGTGKVGGTGQIGYNDMRTKIMNLGIDYEIAEHLLYICTTTARDRNHCIQSALGVATSESSLFKRCYRNNCFGLMKGGQVMGYDSIKHNISDWIERYNKYRYKLDAYGFMNKAKYCQSECKYRIGNFLSTVNKLEI